MTKHSKITRRRFLVAGLATLGVASFVLVERPRIASILTPTVTQGVSQQALDAFNSVLNRTKIRIYTPTGQIVRDLRDSPYSNGIEYGWQGSNPWESAFIRTDEAETPEKIDSKSNILWGLYYAPHNVDGTANNWGDVPVVVCDTFYCGAYMKVVEVDGAPIFNYETGMRGLNFSWIHFNLTTNECKVL
jgi:hypothetical protein